jgi:hypothetical protein
MSFTLQEYADFQGASGENDPAFGVGFYWLILVTGEILNAWRQCRI